LGKKRKATNFIEKKFVASLLVVEDEESLAESLTFSLEKYGYQVKLALDGNEALTTLKSYRPDLILLDVMLPGTDGFEICRLVQKQENPIPIIMISARSSETDRVVGLELGADDYVIKPFSTRELEARIKTVLRRKKGDEAKIEKAFELDWEKRVAKRAGKTIDLSPKEWDLLICLAAANGNIISKEEMLKKVWGEDFVGDPKTLEIHIHWLRQKLEIDPSHPKHILTVKRKGYRFEF
jgi:DNA-binding response OmpR family regulator